MQRKPTSRRQASRRLSRRRWPAPSWSGTSSSSTPPPPPWCSARCFFPNTGSELDGIIAAFLTYAVGFVARPLGGIVFGHFGDKFGRKKLLQLSIILVGVATFLMGCLPTFAADRLLGPGAAGLPAVHPGLRRRRRMGRRSPARGRAQPQQVPRLLGQLAAGRRAGGQPARHRRAVRPDRHAVPRSLPGLGLAGGVLAVRRGRLVGYYIRTKVTDAPIFLEARRRWRRTRRSLRRRRGASGATRVGVFTAMGLRFAREHHVLPGGHLLDHLPEDAWSRPTPPRSCCSCWSPTPCTSPSSRWSAGCRTASAASPSTWSVPSWAPPGASSPSR